MHILRILFLVLLANSSFGQINFFNLYSDNDDDYGEGIVQLEDSSYVITGSSSSFHGTGSEAFLLKIDSAGNYQWSNNYGGLETDVGRRVLYRPNDGFYIAGHTNSYGNGGYDFYLVKTDLSGNLEWEKSYGDFAWERVHDAVLTTGNEGVIMVGETNSTMNNNTDMYIVRTDLNGDTLWTKQMGTDNEDMLTSIHALDDSTYYIAGSMYLADSSKVKGCVMKIHENGTIYWTKYYGYLGDTYINDIHIVNSEIVGVGHTNKISNTFLYEFYFRLDLDGNLVIENYSGSSGERIALAVVPFETPDKYYIAYSLADQWSFPDGFNDIAIARFDDSLYWEQNVANIAHYEPDFLNELIPTSDGGAIAVGGTNSLQLGYHHVCVVKIGPNDTYPYCAAPHTLLQLVDVDETMAELGIEIFPNPAKDYLTIRSDLGSDLEVELINGFGQVVRSERLESSSNTLNISDLASGIYFVKISVDGKVGVQKVVIE
ncbi:MAG: T9SS type A sorting domain-containing protein [Crocinitomicaceae bacterium]|nr:T9SS type A sorting domain-containing protein [Crocinitomicaceae bacterium]